MHTQAKITKMTTQYSKTVEQIGGHVKWFIRVGASYPEHDPTGINAECADAPQGGQRGRKAAEVCGW